MEIHIYKESDELISALAELIHFASQEAIAQRGQFNFVLSGGSSPRKLYKLLSSQTYKGRIDWKHSYFFFGDERFVPENDPQRNSLMAKEALFDTLNIPASHIFMINTKSSPSHAAQLYSETIASHFHQKPVHFDFVLLGLGENAHTASLFPYTTVLEDTEATIKAVYVEELKTYRITMTAPLINQSRYVAFLVFGMNKAEAVNKVLQVNNVLPQKYPAQLIRPKEGELHWFLDTKASALMKPQTKQ